MRRSAELALLLTGVFLLGAAGWKALRYSAFQSHPEWFSAVSRESHQALPGPLTLLHPTPTVRVVGRLEIPRLRMSVIIVDGDDEGKLELAAGHVPGTAAIGAAGNAVIAGHRDTTFRPLRDIRLGDQIRIESDRSYSYTVQSVAIVNPDDIRVLQSDEKPVLTIITCYPFRYMGDAPKRFIVRAKKSET